MGAGSDRLHWEHLWLSISVYRQTVPVCKIWYICFHLLCGCGCDLGHSVLMIRICFHFGGLNRIYFAILCFWIVSLKEKHFSDRIYQVSNRKFHPNNCKVVIPFFSTRRKKSHIVSDIYGSSRAVEITVPSKRQWGDNIDSYSKGGGKRSPQCLATPSFLKDVAWIKMK